MNRIIAASVAFAAACLKWAALVFIFTRFHGSWLGLTVTLGIAILVFRVDRTVVRLATAGLRARS